MNILIVDAFSSGKLLAKCAFKRDINLYHLISGTEYPENYMRDMAESEKMPYKKTYRLSPGKNIDDIIDELKSKNFVAVMPGAEVGVTTAEVIAQKLGLPTNDKETTLARRNKYLMQKALKDNNLNNIPMLKTGSLDEAVEFFKNSKKGKIVLKPLADASSENVFVCNTEKQVKECFSKVINTKSSYGDLNSNVLLQEFIEGNEYVVNCVSRHGHHVVTDMYLYNKFQVIDEKTGLGNIVYDVHYLLKEFDQDIVKNYVFKVLDCLGIKYGASHMELKISETGPILIEVGARMMGHVPSYAALSEALGYDPCDWVLDSYLSDELFDKHKDQVYSPKKRLLLKTFISDREFDIKSIPAEENLKYLKSFNEMRFPALYKTKHVERTINENNLPGECMLLHESNTQVLNDYNMLLYMEKFTPNLLFEPIDFKGFTEKEEDVLYHLKNNIPIEEKIEGSLIETYYHQKSR